MTTFESLVHADWSVNARGRWAATADRVGGLWHARAPFPVPPLDRFVDDLLAMSADKPVLAGFDFPIGLPAGVGPRTGHADFPAALAAFDADFYRVAAWPEEIGPGRPFYPARAGGALRQHLLDGHGVPHIDALMRRCERRGPGLRAASCMFWTLGAAQVGRAALTGWRDVIGPARQRGARLWPFDGDLDALAGQGGLTLVETYPADGYARLGARFGARQSKRRQGDRAAKAPPIEAWAERLGVTLDPPLQAALRDGFGAVDRGGDRFDAVVGLLAMIDILAATPVPEVPRDPAVRSWEGWILGRPAMPFCRSAGEGLSSHPLRRERFRGSRDFG